MNAKLLPAALSSLAAAATLFTATTAEANCGAPDRIEIDSIQFSSWTRDVGGSWQALPSNGISHGKCYKQEAGINNDPEVLFNISGMWYVAVANDCDSIGGGTTYAPFFQGPAADPTGPAYVHGFRNLRIEVLADDAYRVEVDGVQQDILFNGQTVSEVTEQGYRWVGVVELEVPGEGDLSTVEIHAYDTGTWWASMAAAIFVDDGACGLYKTGTDAFAYGNVVESNGISLPHSGSEAPVVTNSGLNVVGSLADLGAEWIWWSADSTLLGEADFSIDITAP